MPAVRLPARLHDIASGLDAVALLARAALAAAAALPLAAAGQSADAGRPLWEAGIAVGGGRVVDYPGADQAHVRGAVLPVLIYRGPLLRIDGQGIRGRLVTHPDFEFDVSASAAFNARSNDARAGMPGLDYLFGIGPQLLYKGWRTAPGAPTLHVKLQAIASTDFHRIDGRGAALQPELAWRVGSGPTAITFGVQPTWASGALQRYFYEVPPADATAGRPAYSARSGYLGTELKATLTRRFGPALSGFAALRAMALDGAANADSPLLRQKHNASVGVGIVWTPWRSSRPAPP